MHPSQIPQKPLYASANPEVLPAAKVYFFERHNGVVFPVDGKTAHEILSGRTKILGPVSSKPKLIGVSNGEIYRRAMIESQAMFKEKGLEASQARLRKGLDEELIVARGKIERPPNYDTVGMNGQPVNINLLR